jgi:hypothetical protein
MAATDPIAPEPRRFAMHLPHWGWFLLMTVVLVIAGIGLSIWLPYYREQKIVEKIRSSGGYVRMTSDSDWRPWLVRDGSVFDRVWLVEFTDSEITDADLLPLEGLLSPSQLNLSGTAVSDVGLAHLRGMSNLDSLRLDGTRVTAGGLVHLRKLTKLRSLYFDGTTTVADAGLIHLSGLRNLKNVYLHDTQVTDNGVEALQKALPDCTIHR